jgi:predicted transcriptional regulator with HTH domain
VIRTYRDDLSNVKGCVATIGFQYDLAIAMFPLPDVCEPSGGYWVLADDLDALWAKPTTAGWQG